jgi:hypothetical protein
MSRKTSAVHEPIALVGIGCRLPGGADDPDAFWALLAEGREAVGEHWNPSLKAPCAWIPSNGPAIVAPAGDLEEAERLEAIVVSDVLLDPAFEVRQRRRQGLAVKCSVVPERQGREGGLQATGDALEEACKQAGLRQIGWHVLRHTFASHLVMRGAPLKAAQELLGHASIEMTMRYAHLSPDARRDAVGLHARHDASLTAT